MIKKNTTDFYLIFIWLYITGRICLVSTYTIGQENIRDIKIRVLPQNVLTETAPANQNEKNLFAILRKKTFLKPVFITGIFQYPVSAGLYQTSKAAYHGTYIDPPCSPGFL